MNRVGTETLTYEEMMFWALLFPGGVHDSGGSTQQTFSDCRRIMEPYIRAALAAAASRIRLDLKQENDHAEV